MNKSGVLALRNSSGKVIRFQFDGAEVTVEPGVEFVPAAVALHAEQNYFKAGLQVDHTAESYACPACNGTGVIVALPKDAAPSEEDDDHGEADDEVEDDEAELGKKAPRRKRRKG